MKYTRILGVAAALLVTSAVASQATPPASVAAAAPASVAAPFGFGVPNPLPFELIRRHAAFELRRGMLTRVEPDARFVVDGSGEPIHYDKLLIAVGAQPKPALDGAISFGGSADAPAVTQALADSARPMNAAKAP